MTNKQNRLLRLPKELPVWLQGKQLLNSPMSFFTFIVHTVLVFEVLHRFLAIPFYAKMLNV